MLQTRLAPWIFPVLIPALFAVATCAVPVRGEPPLDIYIQLIETNTDTFDPELAPARPYIPPRPYDFDNGRLTVNSKIFALNKTALSSQFIPLTNELNAEALNATRFFLTLRRDYRGTGRTSFYDSFYVFNTLPFRLPRPAWSFLAGAGELVTMPDIPGAKPEPVVVYPESVSEIFINPTDPITATQEARLWPTDLEISSVNATGGIELVWNNRKIMSAPGEHRTLSSMNKTVRVYQWRFDNTRSDYGNITFSTQLRIINRGPVEVAGLPRKQ